LLLPSNGPADWADVGALRPFFPCSPPKLRSFFPLFLWLFLQGKFFPRTSHLFLFFDFTIGFPQSDFLLPPFFWLFMTNPQILVRAEIGNRFIKPLFFFFLLLAANLSVVSPQPYLFLIFFLAFASPPPFALERRDFIPPASLLRFGRATCVKKRLHGSSFFSFFFSPSPRALSTFLSPRLFLHRVGLFVLLAACCF